MLKSRQANPELQTCLVLLLTIFSLNFKIFLFIYFWQRWVFVAARGLSRSCGERGLLFVAVCRLLIALASLAVEHGL